MGLTSVVLSPAEDVTGLCRPSQPLFTEQSLRDTSQLLHEQALSDKPGIQVTQSSKRTGVEEGSHCLYKVAKS